METLNGLEWITNSKYGLARAIKKWEIEKLARDTTENITEKIPMANLHS